VAANPSESAGPPTGPGRRQEAATQPKDCSPPSTRGATARPHPTKGLQPAIDPERQRGWIAVDRLTRNRADGAGCHASAPLALCAETTRGPRWHAFCSLGPASPGVETLRGVVELGSASIRQGRPRPTPRMWSAHGSDAARTSAMRSFRMSICVPSPRDWSTLEFVCRRSGSSLSDQARRSNHER